MFRKPQIVAFNPSKQLPNSTSQDTKVTGLNMNEFLTPYDLHRRWSKAISLKTLANWRSLSLGPPYVKFGGRVLYRVADVLFWENQNHFTTKI